MLLSAWGLLFGSVTCFSMTRNTMQIAIVRSEKAMSQRGPLTPELGCGFKVMLI